MSTCFGFKEPFLHEMTFPAFEKNLSLGTDVAGIPKTSLAINASLVFVTYPKRSLHHSVAARFQNVPSAGSDNDDADDDDGDVDGDDDDDDDDNDDDDDDDDGGDYDDDDDDDDGYYDYK
ncbi:hypothetical protein ElyMa_003242400 [Elysia marginata]|uniref:Uncharacterized protein n=1 Tax=Elysia marginata TaxID=1093978 RepID=A0AAV4J5C3_9GAST|nr:hypothetical protein ElyMa_003242400 [Elysia marginata]